LIRRKITQIELQIGSFCYRKPAMVDSAVN